MHDPDATLTVLDGRRYGPGQVLRAAQISHHALSNYTIRSGLTLCSESTGQGRAREYCLADVYQLTLLAQLAAATRNVAWCAAALNELLLGEALFRAVNRSGTPEPGPEHLADAERDLRLDISRSIVAAPKSYHVRDLQHPVFVWTPAWNLQEGPPQLKVSSMGDPDADDLWSGAGVAVSVNLTATLIEIDRRLLRTLPTGGPGADG